MGITLLLLCRIKIDVVILGNYDQDQVRLAFGEYYTIEELLGLCRDHYVEDLVLQSLFQLAFNSLLIPAEATGVGFNNKHIYI